MKNNKRIKLGILVLFLAVSTLIFNISRRDINSLDKELDVSKAYSVVRAGDEKISGTDYVTFDAFYLRDLDGDGYAEKIRGSCREIGKQDTLYMDLNVLTNGTLKNAKITINSNNFYFSTALVKDSVIAQDYVSANTREIKLNDIQNGNQKLIFGITRSGDYTSDYTKSIAIDNIDKYSIANSITLTGTHVADDGTEKQISKTVNFVNDWYGVSKAYINGPYSQGYDIESAKDLENQKLRIGFNIYSRETQKDLIIKSNVVEGVLPQINGYSAEEVIVSNQGANITFDKETGKFVITNEAEVTNNKVSKKLSYDINYNVTAIYPLEAYTTSSEEIVSLDVPVTNCFYCYNNPGTDYDNPYKSNVATNTLRVVYAPVIVNTSLGVWVGEYVTDVNYTNSRYVVSKEKAINKYNNVESEDEKDTYNVRWDFSAGEDIQGKAIVLKEQADNHIDKFQDKNGNYTDMTNYTSNIGIRVSGATNLLGEDGFIKVYNDDTNELICELNKDNWNNQYNYEQPIDHIRLETSEIVQKSGMYIYNIKELDDLKIVADYSLEEFDNLYKIHSYVEMNSGEINRKVSNSAFYEEPYSYAKLTIEPSTITNQETKKNVKLNIKTESDTIIKRKWVDGIFLVKYPSEIIDVNINSVTSEDRNVSIIGVDTYEENGNIFTKIYTSNTTEKNLNITIDADLTADPRNQTANTKVDLYYSNKKAENYYYKAQDLYDVNDNENVQENVGISSADLSLIAPLNLLISQTATDFDDNNSIAVAPQEATIDKSSGEKTAKINLNITNNYSSTISEVKIVGKIPFAGNKYQLNGASMDSQFDTYMTDEGIQLDDEIKEYAVIYYSEKEDVNEDLTIRKNGWTTTPSDMSKVKSYLIDLGNYVMPVDNTKTFSYTIRIPNIYTYNQVTYTNYAAYYCLDTTEGKLKTQTETNKLGIRIAEKYDLEITNYQKNTQRPIVGTVFSVEDVETSQVKIAPTYISGVANLKNLYVEKEYIVKEIKANDNYILDETETRFIGHVVDGELVIEILSGGFNSEPIVSLQENANAKVRVTKEDEVKYKLEIDKIQLGTSEKIKGIVFSLTDYNEKVRTFKTNSRGELSITQLEPGKQYTLTETDTKGHYQKNPISFIMNRNENNDLVFNILSGELDSNPQLDLTNEVPVVKTELLNEKIPTYTLRVTNKEADTENLLQGTQFVIEGENKNSNILYETEVNGQTIIEGLYQYVDGKEINGEYTLKELFPPQGYVINEEPIVFKLNNENDVLSFELISGNIREEIENVQIDETDPDNPIIDITIDNEPVFTLTKVDAETQEPLEGVKFKITDMNDNDLVRDANGELINYQEKEKINLTSGGNYPWTQDENGVWQSGNYNIADSTSILTSDDIEITENSTLSFYWSVSSGAGDYLGCRIVNLNNNQTIFRKEINGVYRVYNDGSLKYEKVENTLNSGKYRIEFIYTKDKNTDSGLDSGFVKDIVLVESDGGIKTDSNGKIRLSLKEGLYKAVETQPLEGYETPDLYTGIGIGANKKAEYSIAFDEEFADYCNNSCIVKVEDGIIVFSGGNTAGVSDIKMSKYDFDGNLIWIKNGPGYVKKALVYDDCIYVINHYRVISKYDFEGNLITRKLLDNISLTDLEIIEGGFLICTNRTVLKLDYDFNEIARYNFGNSTLYNIISISDNKYVLSGTVHLEGYLYGMVTIDSQGNILDRYDNQSMDTHLTKLSDGFLYISDKKLKKYDFNMNLIWEIDNPYAIWLEVSDGLIGIKRGAIIKLDNNGNEIWRKEGVGYSVDYNNCCLANDGVIAITSYGKLIKYDFNGNIVWENDGYHYIKDIAELDDGFVAVAWEGDVIKYNSNKEIVWRNTDIKGVYNYIVTNSTGIFTSSNNEISKYSLDGELLWSKSFERQITSITAIDDYILYSSDNFSRNYLVKVSNDGEIISEINTSKTIKKLKASENYLVALTQDQKLEKYDLNGNLIWSVDESGSNFIIQDDNIIVCNNYTISKYDSNGNLNWQATNDNQIRGTFVDGISVDNGYIFFLYSYYDTGYVLFYDFDGNLISRKEFTNLHYYRQILVNNSVIVRSYLGELSKYDLILTAPEIESAKNIIVENDLKKFNITTKVNGVGGTISGEDEDVYEEVKYDRNSTKDIVIDPETDYKIQTIEINGKAINFTEDENGNVTLDKFYNVKEDKEIVVTFANVNKSFVINKKDEITNDPLENATFNIKQIEDREEPNTNDILGEIVANGEEYYYPDYDQKIDGVVKEKQDSDDYYFIENEAGGYESNNQGVSNSTANSYFKIDLTDKTGKYAIVVNANVSSESNDYGYATIMDDTTRAPEASYGFRRFMYISGTGSQVTTPKDYYYVLEGGKEYYLYIGYNKNYSGNSGNDKLIVNSIDVYGTYSESYSFVDNGNGGYESNNQGKANTTAYSYIPIDLTGYKGKYDLVMNSNINGAGYGYANIRPDTNRIAHDAYENTRFIHKSYNGISTDTITLNGGQYYYLHLGYSRNTSTYGQEKYTINSINIVLNQDDFLPDTEIVTNSNGEASIELEDGRYEITEVKAPEGYSLNREKRTIDFRAGETEGITISDMPVSNLIVHHYLKNTTTPVADDEFIEGDLGKEYSTAPKTDLEKYELVKKADGSYDIPDNAYGVYTSETQVVTYYYEPRLLKVIVHHYIDGTQEKVAEDEQIEGVEGERYKTSSVEYPTLDKKYELVESSIPENANGTFAKTVEEVIYWYKLIDKNVTTSVNGIGGTISGENDEVYENVPYGKSSSKEIKIVPGNNHVLKELEINGMKAVNMVASGAEIEKTDYSSNRNDLLGPLTANGKYYFVERDGVLVNNNPSMISTANSYIKIDLTDYEDNFILYVKSKIDTNFSNYGYATITESEEAPQYNNSNGRFIYLNYSNSGKFYATNLTGGKVYYLHLGFYNSSNNGSYSHLFTINSINLYKDKKIVGDDKFVLTDKGTLESTNKFVANSTANSYIPIDLTNYQGQYKLIVNSSISSDSYDYGYATIRTDTTVPTYNDAQGRFLMSSGYISNKDYSTTLSGGQMYYLHLGYYKNGNTDIGEDKFTINSIRLEKTDGSEEQINIQVLPDDNSVPFVLSRLDNVTENKNIVAIFDVPRATINVSASWDDEENRLGKRPESTLVELYGNDNLVQTIEIKDSEEWKNEFENIPLYDDNGDKIEYTIKQKENNANDLEFYTSSVEITEENTYVVNNKFEIPSLSKTIIATNNWEDNSNENSKRPEKVKLQLKNGDEIVEEQEIDVLNTNSQTYTFVDKPFYDNNLNEIQYSVEIAEVNEDDLKFYSKAVDNDNYIITNTFAVPEDKVEKTINISWEDNLNATNARPNTIKVIIKNGDTNVQEYSINSNKDSNNQEYTFENLAKYNSVGNEIDYLADIEDLVGYDSDASGLNIVLTIQKNTITTNVNGEGGTITQSNEEVPYNGTSIDDIIVTPNEGYEISKITVNGEEIEYSPDENGNYTLPKFENVTGNVNVEVEFKKKEYEIKIELGSENGKVNGEDTFTETVKHGETSVEDVVITPNEGYEISKITVNGEEIEISPDENGNYTLPKFENVTGNVNVEIEFKKIEEIVEDVDNDKVNLPSTGSMNYLVIIVLLGVAVLSTSGIMYIIKKKKNS